MHADKTNRSAMLLLAIVLIVVGGGGAATSFGAFGKSEQHKKLGDGGVWSFFGSNGGWLWPVLGLVALIVIVLCFRWLVALMLSTDRAEDLRIKTEKGAGKTILTCSALTAAVATEIESYTGVSAARARIIGDRDDPKLVVTVTVEDSADFAALRSRIEAKALTHARQALDNPALPIQLDLIVTTKRATRVA